MKEAVQLALKQNPQVIASRLEALERERDSQVQRSTLLPQAQLTSLALLSQYNLGKVERIPARESAGPYQFIQAGPSYSQTIFDLPLIRKYEISRENIVEARAEETLSRESIAAAVVSQYILVLRAFAVYDAAKARVDLADRLYEQAASLQRSGIGLNIDCTRAQVELQNERQNLTDAETLTHTTTYVLAELLDLPIDHEPLVTDRLQLSALPDVDTITFIDAALQTRPEIRVQTTVEKVVQLERKSASEERLPTIDFAGDWFYGGTRLNNGVPAYDYTASFSLPLFTSGRIHAEMAKTALEQQRVNQNRRLLEARIVREVRSAIDDLTAARKNVDLANKGLELAQEEVAQAQRRFAAGVTTNVEVVTAQDALARANANQIDALYRFNQSKLNLARASGEVEITYAK
jgi:outer membrane protein TolC